MSDPYRTINCARAYVIVFEVVLRQWTRTQAVSFEGERTSSKIGHVGGRSTVQSTHCPYAVFISIRSTAELLRHESLRISVELLYVVYFYTKGDGGKDEQPVRILFDS